MAHFYTALERQYKDAGWCKVVRSSDWSWIVQRANEMKQQGWQVHVLPYGRTKRALWAAPQGTPAPAMKRAA